MIDEARPSIAVWIDRSVSAIHATRWAAREAAAHNLALRLVSIWASPDGLCYQEMWWVREVVSIARAVAGPLDVAAVAWVGDAAEVLFDESMSARLVVLGARGLDLVGATPAGSVAREATRRAQCPVVVVHGRTHDDPPPGAGPVLVGVGGTGRGAGDGAIDFALDAASSRGTELIAMHSGPPDGAYSWDYPWLGQWQHKYPHVPVRRVPVNDLCAAAVLERAERLGAQLIVTGAAPERALLVGGSCPVAVVGSPPDGPQGS